MGELEERLTEVEYKMHELRDEIDVNYKHTTDFLRLLKRKFPDEFEPGNGIHLNLKNDEYDKEER